MDGPTTSICYANTLNGYCRTVRGGRLHPPVSAPHISKEVLKKARAKERELERANETLRIQRAELLCRVSVLEESTRYTQKKLAESKRRNKRLSTANSKLKNVVFELKRVLLETEKAKATAVSFSAAASAAMRTELEYARRDDEEVERPEVRRDQEEDQEEEDNYDDDDDDDDDDSDDNGDDDAVENQKSLVEVEKTLSEPQQFDTSNRAFIHMKKAKCAVKHRKQRPVSASSNRGRSIAVAGRIRPSSAKQLSTNRRPLPSGSIKRSNNKGVAVDADFDRLLQRDRLYIKQLVEEQRESARR